MARTVPRNIDRKGQHLSRCDVCGSMWLRSALRRGRDGLLRCEQDWAGRDAVTLSELTANRAASIAMQLGSRPPADGAACDTDSNGDNSSASDYTGTSSRYTVGQVYDGAVPTYANPGTRVGLPGF